MASNPNPEIVETSGYRFDLKEAGDISGYTIQARDGEIGTVDKHDMDTGSARLVVSTGPWIFGKSVTLPAEVIESIDHESETVHVNVTREQIKNAPEYDQHHPEDA